MTQPLVSPKCDVWETSTEILYCYSVRTWIWVLLLIGSKFASTNQKHLKNSRHAPGRLCSWKYLLISFWCEIEQAHSTIFYSNWNSENGECWKFLAKLAMIFYSYAAKLFIKLSTLIIFIKVAFFNQHRSGK